MVFNETRDLICFWTFLILWDILFKLTLDHECVIEVREDAWQMFRVAARSSPMQAGRGPSVVSKSDSHSVSEQDEPYTCGLGPSGL